MKNLQNLVNPFNDDKVISACSLFGMMNLNGDLFSGKDVITAITNMNYRTNGLGGGFAIYGLYPEYKDYYAFHIAYNRNGNSSTLQESKEVTENFLKSNFKIVFDEEVPTQNTEGIVNPPLMWRYFLQPKNENKNLNDDDFVIEKVMTINLSINGAYVFSSGKDMAVFKGVGYPDQIANYFCLENYKGYIWTAHGRFPTNTQAWWGGAHPFNILDWTVIHNGEISSYGINRKYLEMFGYKCTMQTDTEVLAYATDLLSRRHKLPIETVMDIFAPPIWEAIDMMEAEEKNYFLLLRQVYSSLLINGPFAIIVAHHGEMIGHNDRIRLRPMTGALKDDFLFISSEEASIRLVCKELDKVWTPAGGSPIIGRVRKRE